MAVMRLTALRQHASAARLARALWIAWALILWNVVFDHVIVVAGRQYILAAKRAAYSPGLHRYENMDAWMRPAVSRALWIATGTAGTVLAAGLVLVHTANVRSVRG